MDKVHSERALIGWRISSGKLSKLLCKSMEGGENHEPPRFCIKVNVPRGGQKLAASCYPTMVLLRLL